MQLSVLTYNRMDLYFSHFAGRDHLPHSCRHHRDGGSPVDSQPMTHRLSSWDQGAREGPGGTASQMNAAFYHYCLCALCRPQNYGREITCLFLLLATWVPSQTLVFRPLLGTLYGLKKQMEWVPVLHDC